MPAQDDFAALYRYACSLVQNKRPGWKFLRDGRNVEDVVQEVMGDFLIYQRKNEVKKPKGLISAIAFRKIYGESKERKSLDAKFPPMPSEGYSEEDTGEVIVIREKVNKFLEQGTLTPDELMILRECLEMLASAERKLFYDYFLKDSTTRSLQASYSVSYVIIAKRAKEIRRKVRDCVEGE